MQEMGTTLQRPSALEIMLDEIEPAAMRAITTVANHAAGIA
jgi:hypothetical protein